MLSTSATAEVPAVPGAAYASGQPWCAHGAGFAGTQNSIMVVATKISKERPGGQAEVCHSVRGTGRGMAVAAMGVESWQGSERGKENGNIQCPSLKGA